MPGSMIEITLEQQGNLEALQKLANFEAVAGPHFESAMRSIATSGRTKVVEELKAVAAINRDSMAAEVLGGNITPLAPVSMKAMDYRIKAVVQVEGPTNMMVVIGDLDRKYLRMAEGGRGPGKHPPARVLQAWAERNLGVEHKERTTKKGRVIVDLTVGRALAHAIAQKGIKGSPVMQRTGMEIERQWISIFEVELRKIAAELGFTG